MAAESSERRHRCGTLLVWGLCVGVCTSVWEVPRVGATGDAAQRDETKGSLESPQIKSVPLSQYSGATAPLGTEVVDPLPGSPAGQSSKVPSGGAGKRPAVSRAPSLNRFGASWLQIARPPPEGAPQAENATEEKQDALGSQEQDVHDSGAAGSMAAGGPTESSAAPGTADPRLPTEEMLEEEPLGNSSDPPAANSLSREQSAGKPNTSTSRTVEGLCTPEAPLLRQSLQSQGRERRDSDQHSDRAGIQLPVPKQAQHLVLQRGDDIVAAPSLTTLSSDSVFGAASVQRTRSPALAAKENPYGS